MPCGTGTCPDSTCRGVFQTADDALGKGALERSRKFAQVLRGTGFEAVVVVEVLAARGESPFVVEGVLDVAGDPAPTGQGARDGRHRDAVHKVVLAVVIVRHERQLGGW